MKKIFTLFIAFFAMIICAKAQVSIFSENFDSGTPNGWIILDSDGDTYSWENSTTTTSYFVAGTDISGTGHNQSTGHMLSGSYSNVYGALTPDNWLITPAITLSSASILTFWLCAQDATYPNEHYGVYVSTTAGTTPSDFTLLYEETIDANGGSRVQGAWKQKTVNLSNYTGQTVRIGFRHFNCSDQFILNLDDVEISAAPTSPTIVAAQSVDFGTVHLGQEATQQIPVTAYSLTAGITATTTAPFSISADGTSYSTTATIAQTGGTLYVKYTPTAAGNDNGSVILSSTGATSVTIDLTGNCLDCNNITLPYFSDFSNDAQNQCWTIVDANNDGTTFSFSPSEAYASYHWHSTNAANDWLISPAFTFTGTQSVMFDYKTGSSWEEIYEVFAIGTDTIRLSQPDTVLSSSYLTKVLDVSNLNGSYSIAIHCISEPDMFYLYITNFTVIDASNAIVTVDETDLDFGVIPVNSTAVENFNINTTNLNEAIAITTAAPFEVSLDGTTYSASVTVPADSAFITSTPVYVRFAPTAAGSFNNVVVVATTNTNDTIALTGVGVSCDAITTFPYTETFDETSSTRECWQIVDANNDGTTISFMAYDDNNTGVAAYFYDSDNDANDWLISPEITLPTGGAFLSYDYAASSSTYPEKYSVWVIPQNGTIATAVNILATQTVATSNITNNILDLSTYGNQTIRVAFKVESDADMNYIFFDNVSVSAIGEASITVNPTSMSFSGLVNSATSAQTANVVAIGLTNDVNITATAPFEVSVDGNAFAATATIPQAAVVNTTIYVRMNATTAGAQTGTVTLTSGTATANIALNGSALDCSGAQALPFTEGFESELAECWQNIDNDGDGNTWRSEEGTETKPAHSGNYSYSSESYINNLGALTPDNWLITPALAIPAEGATLAWWVAAQDPNYPADHYEVKVSTSATMSTFTSVYDETIASGDWEERTVNLNNYAGQTIYIAFVHNNCTDIFRMKIDDISVTPGVGINDNDNNVNLYPNPANNVINVNAASNINTIEVFNMMGQRVAVIDANDTNVQINTTALSNGMYLMRITTENGVSNQKFTVAR